MSFSGPLGRTLFTACAAVAGMLLPLVPHPDSERASAATTTSVNEAQQAVSVLSLRVVPSDRAERARSVTLRCEPTGGTHPRAEEACEELANTGGEFGALQEERNPMCPLVYRPVTVRATGMWRNRAVDHRETFSNKCEMQAKTGKLFEF
ncbi:Subtilisin inhibitor-like [Actinopolyspora mzabensis]|uniref:Subtilisin inhibitor-like n=1 Tax=Actinopolyspora mzabensis TaxID=995066 RepID=A0A1G9DHC1_ACTMZ|nr:SSI family serine proteinase inhibitor [Actinopolyspora mzabensis]SDK63297.1 Subtilisin inhibitor-like [Actinopolyspora mzabensis]